MKFEDLTDAQLKKVIKNYRLHLLKELTGYSKMSRDDLINLCKKLFDIDDEKIKPKISEPIYFDIPEGRQPKVEKMKKVIRKKQRETKLEPEQKTNFKQSINNKINSPLFQEMVKESEKLINTTWTKEELDEMDEDFKRLLKAPAQKMSEKKKPEQKRHEQKKPELKKPKENMIELPAFNKQELLKVDNAISKMKASPLDRAMSRIIYNKLNDGIKYLPESENNDPVSKSIIKMFWDIKKQLN